MNNAPIKDVQTVVVDRSSAGELVIQANKALGSAQAIVIDSPELYELAAEELRRVKALQKTIEEKRTSITGPLNEALRATNAVFKQPAAVLEQAETQIKRAMIAWQDVQAALARKAKLEAEERERKQREELEAQAREAQRVADEAAAAAMQAAEQQDEATAVQAANTAMQAQQQAETLATTAAVTTVAPRFEAPKAAAGIATRKTYKHTVTDLAALVQAVAAGKAPIECLQANDTFLRGQTNAYKKAGELFPGVVVTEQSAIAARGI